MPRIEQRGRELWVLIPEDIAKALALDAGDALSFELLDKELAGIRKTHAVSDEELNVLKKINEIRFAERTKDKIRSLLLDNEQRILGKLMKKGAVQFYEGGKYKDKGVYSITREYYSFLTTAKKPGSAVSKALGQQKYLVTDSLDRVNEVLKELDEQVKNGEIVSVRGFDKKFYLTTRDVVDNVGSGIVSALETSDLELKEIASMCSEPEGLVRTVLEILRESGDVIEKKKGVYSLV